MYTISYIKLPPLPEMSGAIIDCYFRESYKFVQCREHAGAIGVWHLNGTRKLWDCYTVAGCYCLGGPLVNSFSH